MQVQAELHRLIGPNSVYRMAFGEAAAPTCSFRLRRMDRNGSSDEACLPVGVRPGPAAASDDEVEPIETVLVLADLSSTKDIPARQRPNLG